MEGSRVRQLALALLAAAAAAVVTLVILGRRSPDVVLQVAPVNPDGQVTVYIGGAVATPGLYTLPNRTRVAQAVQQAQPLPEADLSVVPMAAVLHDGQQVVVPVHFAEASPASGKVAKVTPTPTPSGPINLNTATAEQLDGLPGVGPTLAQRIVEYRNAHGPFKSLDELVAIRGISNRMIEDWRDRLTVGP